MDNQSAKKAAKPVKKASSNTGTKRKVKAKNSKGLVKKAAPKRAVIPAPSNDTPAGKDTGKKISKILTPKNFEESLGTIVSLRNFCKNCLRYVQQADNLLDTLFVMGNSLQESGVLKKLSESKGKNLNSSDFTNILMALMNTPVGAGLFKRLSGGGEATQESAPATTPAQTVSTEQPAIAGAPPRTAPPAAQPPRLPPGPYYM